MRWASGRFHPLKEIPLLLSPTPQAWLQSRGKGGKAASPDPRRRVGVGVAAHSEWGGRGRTAHLHSRMAVELKIAAALPLRTLNCIRPGQK